MIGVRLFVAAAVGLAVAPAWAAGSVGSDPESRRLAIECLLRAGEKLPKIYSLKVISEAMDQDGDMFEGSFMVSVLHRQVHYDFQCLAGMVSETDLKGVVRSEKRIDKVWVTLRVD